MFRRSSQHTAQYHTEHPASRQDEYPTQDSSWGQGEYPTLDRAWYQDEYPAGPQARRPASRWGEYPTQPGPAWDSGDQPTEPPVARRERPASRWGEYPTQPGPAWDSGDHRAWDSGDHLAPRPVPHSAGRRPDYKNSAEPEASDRLGPAGPARHRKPSLMRSAFRRRAVRVTTAAVVVAAVAGLVVGQKTHWPDLTSQPAALNRAAPRPVSVGHSPAATPADSPTTAGGQRHDSRTGAAGDRHHSAKRRTARRRSSRRKHGIFAYYRNPLRAITGLLPERIDMGVDFGGSGKIYAIGKGVVVTAMTGDGGWPGGGWMSYRLTSGPAAGQMVFVAEDITPTVTVGQTVRSSTVIANMFNGGAGIETGWAQSNGVSPESQAPEAGAIWGQGPFPTAIGMNFEELLQKLGVPAGYGRDQSTFGTLPAGYPTSW